MFSSFVLLLINAAACLRGLSSIAASAGESVGALNAEIITAIAIVIANGLFKPALNPAHEAGRDEHGRENQRDADDGPRHLFRRLFLDLCQVVCDRLASRGFEGQGQYRDG
jgi:hypothetical protein